MVQVTVPLSEELEARLRAIAERQGRSVAELLAAIAEALAANDDGAMDTEPHRPFTAEETADIEEGIAQLDRGEGIPHDKAMALLRSDRSL